MKHETYLRAVELDDDFPLDVCPGCGRDISRVFGEQHYTPSGFEGRRARVRAEFGPLRASKLSPWVTGAPMLANKVELCVWHSDFLTARSLRRKWRLEYEAAHA